MRINHIFNYCAKAWNITFGSLKPSFEHKYKYSSSVQITDDVSRVISNLNKASKGFTRSAVTGEKVLQEVH